MMTPEATGSPPTKDNARGQAGEVGKADSDQQDRFCAAPSATVKPSFPDPKFLPGRVLAILLSGRRFTHLDSWRELGHARLADSIWKLRRLGWAVAADDEVMTTSDGGRQATVAVYYLPPNVIAEWRGA